MKTVVVAVFKVVIKALYYVFVGKNCCERGCKNEASQTESSKLSPDVHEHREEGRS